MKRRKSIAGAGVAIGAVCVTGAAARDREAIVKDVGYRINAANGSWVKVA